MYFRVNSPISEIDHPGARMVKVLLIHGVHADTSWQDRIRLLLRPHFEPVTIRYHEFQRLEGLSLLGFESLLSRLPLPDSVTAIAAANHRVQAREAVAQQMGRHMDAGPPHIVAHSFGSYLTAIIFQSLDWPQADRIIFAGAAVAENFPWERVRRPHGRGDTISGRCATIGHPTMLS